MQIEAIIGLSVLLGYSLGVGACVLAYYLSGS